MIRTATLIFAALMNSAVTFKAAQIDRYENSIRAPGVELFTSFTTVYQINGKPVEAAAFWATVHPNSQVQAKLLRRNGQWWAARINIQEK